MHTDIAKCGVQVRISYGLALPKSLPHGIGVALGSNTPRAVTAACASLQSASITLSKVSVIVFLRLNLVGAPRLEMAHLLAVRAFDTRHYVDTSACSKLSRLKTKEKYLGKLTVTRLGAFLGAVAVLIAVTALEVGHVLRLSAITGPVALLTTVAAATRACLRAVLGKVTNYTWTVSLRGQYKSRWDVYSLSLHLRHSTSAAERGSGPVRITSQSYSLTIQRKIFSYSPQSCGRVFCEFGQHQIPAMPIYGRLGKEWEGNDAVKQQSWCLPAILASESVLTRNRAYKRIKE